ncbi:MAG: hypothetical protein DRP87_02685 [Spirochaetes bacterium]|nr:MAG: hypothetical protein DRP87_02685 [Spirochaetota bacterium]
MLPAENIESFLYEEARLRISLPVIAYGKDIFLKTAFLSGCEDFLKDPWSPEEMIIRSLRFINNRKIDILGVFLYLSPTCISSDHGSQNISVQEYTILKVLIQNRGTVVPREALYYALWGKPGGDSRVVDMHISSLRKKIKSLVPESKLKGTIKTARKSGYIIG